MPNFIFTILFTFINLTVPIDAAKVCCRFWNVFWAQYVGMLTTPHTNSMH